MTVDKTSSIAIIPNLKPCTKYEMTVTKYLGLENEENISDKKETSKPIFTGETGVSITAYTSIDLDLPFKLNSLKVKEDLSSISLFWSKYEFPCIDMTNMLKFRICENKDETSCLKNEANAKNDQKPGSKFVTTTFQGLDACTSYLVSENKRNKKI